MKRIARMQQTVFEKEIQYVSFNKGTLTIQRRRNKIETIAVYILIILTGAVFGISSDWGGHPLLGLAFAIGMPLVTHLGIRTRSKTKRTAINFAQRLVEIEDTSGNIERYLLKAPDSFKAEVVEKRRPKGYEHTLFIQFDELRFEIKELGLKFRKNRKADQIRLLALLLNEGIKTRQAPASVFYRLDTAHPTQTQCLYYTSQQHALKTARNILVKTFLIAVLIAISVPVLLLYAAIAHKFLG